MTACPALLLLAATLVSSLVSTTSRCLLPPELESLCQCGASLECRDLNTTLPLSLLPPGTAASISSLSLVNSELTCLELQHLSLFSALTELSVRHSGLTAPFCPPAPSAPAGHLRLLSRLDLSHNNITRLGPSFPPLPSLTSLNLSHNALTRLEPVLKELPELRRLDLSHNRLSQLERRVMEELPASLTQLEISDNPWPCLPSLSWLYSWAAQRNISSSSSCAIPLSPTSQQAPLLTVMQHYATKVSPHCHPGCRCHFYHFKLLSRSFVAGTNISYTVIVNCTNAGLTSFPSLPPQTTVLDLSHNKLTQDSLEMLDVGRQNYLDLNSLILSHNNIQSIGTKLLKLKLHRSFKADHNSLTDIPYDFSQVLQKYDTMFISLANNPWQCSCTAQITDTVNISLSLSLK